MRGLPEPINVVKDDIRTLLQERNQVHLMGLLFVKHLGMPFMKKDIISRGIHLLRDVPILVEEEDLDTPEAILVPFRYRGSPASR